MVKVNLSVAFILAATTIAPVVAPPPPTNHGDKPSHAGPHESQHHDGSPASQSANQLEPSGYPHGKPWLKLRATSAFTIPGHHGLYLTTPVTGKSTQAHQNPPHSTNLGVTSHEASSSHLSGPAEHVAGHKASGFHQAGGSEVMDRQMGHTLWNRIHGTRESPSLLSSFLPPPEPHAVLGAIGPASSHEASHKALGSTGSNWHEQEDSGSGSHHVPVPVPHQEVTNLKVPAQSEHLTGQKRKRHDLHEASGPQSEGNGNANTGNFRIRWKNQGSFGAPDPHAVSNVASRDSRRENLLDFRHEVLGPNDFKESGEKDRWRVYVGTGNPIPSGSNEFQGSGASSSTVHNSNFVAQVPNYEFQHTDSRPGQEPQGNQKRRRIMKSTLNPGPPPDIPLPVVHEAEASSSNPNVLHNPNDSQVPNPTVAQRPKRSETNFPGMGQIKFSR